MMNNYSGEMHKSHLKFLFHFSIDFRPRAHDPCARYFHYTAAHTICQEKNVKKIKQIIIPKFVYFDY